MAKGLDLTTQYPLVSYYSGPMADASHEAEHDVSACMPGIYIWPDGTVARQTYDPHADGGRRDDPGYVPKGGRPQPTGLKLFAK